MVIGGILQRLNRI